MLAGRVGRPHGLDGSFYVTDPEARLLVVGAEVAGLGTIAGRKGTDAKPIVRLDAVSDRTAAEALRGRELDVPGEPEPLGEDEYLATDLEGCAVVDGDRTLGTVERMLPLPSCEAHELDTGLLVPHVRDAIRSIDVEGKTIDVNGAFLGAA